MDQTIKLSSWQLEAIELHKKIYGNEASKPEPPFDIEYYERTQGIYRNNKNRRD